MIKEFLPFCVKVERLTLWSQKTASFPQTVFSRHIQLLACQPCADPHNGKRTFV